MNIHVDNWHEMPNNKKMNFFSELETLMSKYDLYGGIKL
jgi:hypothetical protein